VDHKEAPGATGTAPSPSRAAYPAARNDPGRRQWFPENKAFPKRHAGQYLPEKTSTERHYPPEGRLVTLRADGVNHGAPGENPGKAF
jgi:hypothetical protein